MEMNETMRGNRGTVIERCAPEGMVRVGSEIWRAISRTGMPLEIGEEIVVFSQKGLLLTVDVAMHNSEELLISNRSKVKNLMKILSEKIAIIVIVILFSLFLLLLRYYLWFTPIVQPIFKIIEGR